MQRFSFTKKKRRIIIITAALILAVQAICLCCISVTSAGGESSSDAVQGTASSDAKDVYEELFNDKVYISSINRARWLKDLMDATGEETSYTGPEALAEEAQKRGILDRNNNDSIYTLLDRDFVCDTLCRAMGYPTRTISFIEDISVKQTYIATAAYYGWFLPDEEGMIHPEAAITAEEYDGLLEELSRYRIFNGKRILAFGDSIMYGKGNNDEGIADIIAEKYGMAEDDYSCSGATMGIYKGRDHIPNQIRKAIKDKAAPDIILINGGTNDMVLTSPGKIADGYDMSKVSEQTFTGGFEKAMWMIKQNWDVPVIYIRAHNMDLVTPENERKFGERGLEIAEKWGARGVDIYSFSGLNADDPEQCEMYTYPNPNIKYECDSIHPNAHGYAKFYLPMICETMSESFIQNEV